MQITDLYQTKITCSTYNANIDSTDTVITVSLIDFNGNAVTGKSVTLTCDKGYFNKKGSTAISGTTTKSITLNTDSNGQITGTWTASEWGLCTFSTNNISNQINVTGLKLVEDNSDGVYKVYANESTVFFYMGLTTNTTIPTTNTEFGGGAKINTEKYRPLHVVTTTAYNNNIIITVKPDGVILRRTTGSSQISSQIYASVSYSRRVL